MMMMSLQPSSGFQYQARMLNANKVPRKATLEELGVEEPKVKPLSNEEQGDTVSFSKKDSVGADKADTELVVETSHGVKKKAVTKLDNTIDVKSTKKTSAKKNDKTADDDEYKPFNFLKWGGIAVGSVVGTVTLFNSGKALHWYVNKGQTPISADELRKLADKIGDPAVIEDVIQKFKHLEPTFSLEENAGITDKVTHWLNKEFILPSLMPQANKNKIVKYIWLEGGMLDSIFSKEEYAKRLNDLSGNTFVTKTTQINVSAGEAVLDGMKDVLQNSDSWGQESGAQLVRQMVVSQLDKQQKTIRATASQNFGDLAQKDFTDFEPVVKEAVETVVNKLLQADGKPAIDVSKLSMDKNNFKGAGAVAVIYHVPGTSYAIKLVKPGINDETIPASLEHQILDQVITKGLDYRTAVKQSLENFSSIAIETNLKEEFNNTKASASLPYSIVNKTQVRDQGITSGGTQYFVMDYIPNFASVADKDKCKYYNYSQSLIEDAHIDIALQSILDKVQGLVQADPHGGNGGIGLDAAGKKATFCIDFGRTLALDPTVAKNKRALELALILDESDQVLHQKLKTIDPIAYDQLNSRDLGKLLKNLKEQPFDSFEQLSIYGFLNDRNSTGLTLPTIQREAELNVNNRIQAGRILAKTQCFVEDMANVTEDNKAVVEKFNANLDTLVSALTQDDTLSESQKEDVKQNLKAKIKEYFYINNSYSSLQNSEDSEVFNTSLTKIPVFNKEVMAMLALQNVYRNIDTYLADVPLGFGTMFKDPAKTFLRAKIDSGPIKQFHNNYYAEYAG